MQIALIAIGYTVLIWVMVVVSFRGLDLKNRKSWRYGVYGFFSGLAIGAGISGNVAISLGTGGIFAFMLLFIGATMRRHKQKYGSMAKFLVQKYEKEETPSLLAKLVKKLLGRYK